VIIKTTALALRIHPYSRTSRVVTWLTPDYGRIVTVIKGASRAKSAFLGQYDLAMRCELLFYRREQGGIHIARECAPLDCRPNLRVNWRGAVVAGYLCELVNRVTAPMLAAGSTFTLLDQTLTALDTGVAPIPSLLRFEFALLETLGLAPDFRPCADCTVTNGRRPCRFLLPSGRLRCVHSISHLPGGVSVAIDEEGLAALRAWQQPAGDPANAVFPATSAKAATVVRRFLGMFLQYHLDLPMAARQAAFAWLETGRENRDEAEKRLAV
jgi:DNA repair protein RecO (recombination protein O)